MMAFFRNISDFDDLVFASRNREYGAYKLRKGYLSALSAGIAAAIIIASALVLIPFLSRPINDRVLAGGTRYINYEMENYQPPPDNIYVPPPPPPPETKKAEETLQYVPPEVVDTVMQTDPVQASTDEIIANAGEETSEDNSPGFGDELFSGDGEGNGMYTDEPFFLVEVMPSFRGGDLNRFREWVQKRTNYPQEALDKKIQGRIFLTFIVETDGAVSNVTVVKGVDPLIDNEAVKAIQASPKWTPGLQRGQPVRVRYSLWLSFVI